MKLSLVIFIEGIWGFWTFPNILLYQPYMGFSQKTSVNLRIFSFPLWNLPVWPVWAKEFFGSSGFFWPEGGSGGYNSIGEGRVKGWDRMKAANKCVIERAQPRAAELTIPYSRAAFTDLVGES